MEGAWAEYCVVVAGAQSNVSNLRAVELGQEQLRLTELERQATEECERCLDKPWNEYPEVCEFLAQFEPGVKFTTRNALVLDGGSRRGKTQFALSLVLAGAGVEVNYSNALQEPPLQELYQLSVRDLILFDECRFELLLKSERIFQGPPVRVVMGSTQNNRFTYQAFVFRKRLLIASNHWKKQIKACDKKDRDCIKESAIYLKVGAPMWTGCLHIRGARRRATPKRGAVGRLGRQPFSARSKALLVHAFRIFSQLNASY